jgi:enterochelin esterase-like enzyme
MNHAVPIVRLTVSLAAMAALASVATAQPPAPPPVAPAASQAGRGPARPAVVSPEVLPDARVVFRIYAPRAESVTLNASDIPAPAAAQAGAQAPPPSAASAVPPAAQAPNGPVFTKSENGVWEATVGPIVPGAFRYVFQVDGVRTLDPVNTRVSESNTANWSLFYVPGLEFQDVKGVPHGAVAEAYYYSTILKTTRRMHVYTPPGYESGQKKYPVFYLLHGSGDCDDSWTSVGRAGFIIDNLIAAGQVPPMVIVMPAGHQPGSGPGPTPPGPTVSSTLSPAVNGFTLEFVMDVMPYVESHYRLLPGRQNCAIAGLSMGGSQTLDVAFRHLDRFGFIGVFSSGASLGGGRGGATAVPPPPDWETVHKANLDDARLKNGTRLIWLSTGVDDRLMANTRTTVEMLQRHGFTPVFKESPGAHTWLNWRDYLREFARQLFR